MFQGVFFIFLENKRDKLCYFFFDVFSFQIINQNNC